MTAIYRFFRDIWLAFIPSSQKWGFQLAGQKLFFFFFAVFFVFALAATGMGFSLESLDAWLDSKATLFDKAGTVLFKIVCGFILLMCALLVMIGASDRIALWRRRDQHRHVRLTSEGAPDAPDKPMGCGGALFCLILGYFAYVGMVM